MIQINSRIVPSLGLGKMTDGDLSDYAAKRVSDVTAHTLDFPGLKPTPAEIAAILALYDSARKKADGSVSNTTDKNKYRADLEAKLLGCANGCSSLAGTDIAKYQRTGFGMREKPVRITVLDVPADLHFKQGPLDGSVFAHFLGVKNAGSYEVQVGTDINVKNWTKFTTSKGSPILVTDLTSLSIGFGRVRAIGARGIKSEWTTIVQFKVM